RDIQNRIVTIFAGAHIKPGSYSEGRRITHVNVLRTLEAMYGLPNSGAQQPNAAGGDIADATIITDVFESQRLAAGFVSRKRRYQYLSSARVVTSRDLTCRAA